MVSAGATRVACTQLSQRILLHDRTTQRTHSLTPSDANGRNRRFDLCGSGDCAVFPSHADNPFGTRH